MLDILKMPFVVGHMQKFVESQGKITFNPQMYVRKEIQPEQVKHDNALQQKDISTLTARERARLMKESRAREEFERMKAAAQEASLRTA